MDNLKPYYVTYTYQDVTQTTSVSRICILLAENETNALCHAEKFVYSHMTEGFVGNFYAKEFSFTDITMADREDIKIYNTLRGNNGSECFSYDNDY